jgi:hypothetical protein
LLTFIVVSTVSVMTAVATPVGVVWGPFSLVIGAFAALAVLGWRPRRPPPRRTR